jgi:hypothetical protein
MDHGKGTEKSKNIQEPQNYDNDHNTIQDRLNGSRHRYAAINQSEENAHHDQSHYDLNQGHKHLPVSEAGAFRAVPGYACYIEPICGSSSPPR